VGFTEVVNEAVRGRPALPVAPYVRWYGGYRQAGIEPGRHRGLPSPYLTLIFTLHEPLMITQHVDPRQAPGTYVSVLGGLHTTPVHLAHDGRQSGIQLAVNPLGARALLGLPAGELAGLDFAADQVLGNWARETCERLASVATWTERFAILDHLLAKHIRDRATVPDEVAHVWHELMASGGKAAVGTLAAEIGWSTRHLANRFRTELGLTPKGAARVIRFDRARRAMQKQAGRGGPLDLATLAVEHGYYDQPHFNRDFAAFTGCAPGRWLTEEFRNIQATSAPTEQSLAS
jgi:AraC-like DNA-binding protein